MRALRYTDTTGTAAMQNTLIHTDTGRQAEADRHTHRHWQADRIRQTDIQTDTGRQAETDRYTHRHRQAGRQTDRKL